MWRVLTGFIVASVLVFAMASMAMAAYTYTDENGTPVIVDCLEKVPQQHRATARHLQSGSGPDGFTPSFEQARQIDNGDSRDVWYRYDQLKWYERTYLLARAGLVDFAEVMKSISHWIGFASIFLAVCYTVTFRMISSRIAQALICFCLTFAVFCGLFYEYVNGVKERKDVIAQKIGMLRGDKQMDQLQRMIQALEE